MEPKAMPDSLNPLTLKKRATADEIHADLQQRIDRLALRDEKYRGCKVSPPKPIDPNKNGHNWTIAGFPDLPTGCFGGVVKIVDQARLEYELIN
jgi:hypothetical protein